MKSSLIAPTQICPNLQPHWQLEHRENSDQWVLQAGDTQHPLTPETAYILQHFVGNLTVTQIQAECDDHFGSATSPTLVMDTIQTLINQGIFSLDRPADIPAQLPLPLIPQQPHSPLLKPTVQWFYHPDSYWILRNAADVTRQLRISPGTLLRAPTEQGLQFCCRDTMQGYLTLELQKIGSNQSHQTIIKATSNLCGLEVGGRPWHEVYSQER